MAVLVLHLEEFMAEPEVVGQNWHYSNLGGITVISKLESQQLQNAVMSFSSL
jgi:hypothetical protein